MRFFLNLKLPCILLATFLCQFAQVALAEANTPCAIQYFGLAHDGQISANLTLTVYAGNKTNVLVEWLYADMASRPCTRGSYKIVTQFDDDKRISVKSTKLNFLGEGQMLYRLSTPSSGTDIYKFYLLADNDYNSIRKLNNGKKPTVQFIANYIKAHPTTVAKLATLTLNSIAEERSIDDSVTCLPQDVLSATASHKVKVVDDVKKSTMVSTFTLKKNCGKMTVYVKAVKPSSRTDRAAVPFRRKTTKASQVISVTQTVSRQYSNFEFCLIKAGATPSSDGSNCLATTDTGVQVKPRENITIAPAAATQSAIPVSASSRQTGQLLDSESWDYSPSWIVDSDGMERIWWCSDRYSFNERDYTNGEPATNVTAEGDVIKYAERRPGGKWSDIKIVLKPEPTGGTYSSWEGPCVCDPAVLRGVFNYNGSTYTYAMYYTASPTCSTDNKIGVAFSNDGISWVKKPGHIIQSSFRGNGGYGAGQAQAYSRDGRSSIFLFHTDTANRADQYLRESSDGINFSAPQLITTRGLIYDDDDENDSNNQPLPLVSASGWAYDWSKHYWYLVTGVRNDSLGRPTTLGVFKIPALDLFNGKWTKVATIEAGTAAPMQHEPGFRTDGYGNITNQLPEITVGFSGSTLYREDIASWSMFAATIITKPTEDVAQPAVCSKTTPQNDTQRVERLRCQILGSGGSDTKLVSMLAAGNVIGVTHTLLVNAKVFDIKSRSDFVTQLYNKLLNRSPDPGGFAYWVTGDGSWMTHSQLVDTFAASSEYRTTILNYPS